MSDPATPRTSAWVSMNDMTWRRVAPAARSRPTSRIRSETVIDSVLKMRNAPANSAIAAISAVVAWKSAVERAQRRRRGPAARTGRTARAVRRASRAAETVAGVGAGGEADVDAGDAGLAEDRLRGPQRDDDGPPERAGQRPVAGEDADDAVA